MCFGNHQMPKSPVQLEQDRMIGEFFEEFKTAVKNGVNNPKELKGIIDKHREKEQKFQDRHPEIFKKT